MKMTDDLAPALSALDRPNSYIAIPPSETAGRILRNQ